MSLISKQRSVKNFNKIRNYFKSNSIEIIDIYGNKHVVLKDMVAFPHNVNPGEFEKYFNNPSIVSYTRQCYYLLWSVFVKITYVDENGKTVTRYFIRAEAANFNICNKALAAKLGISLSTLNDNFIKLEERGIVGRFTEQEAVDGRTRHIAINVKRLMNVMGEFEGNFSNIKAFTFKSVKAIKDIVLRKLVLFRIFTINNVKGNRNGTIQQFINNQANKLKLPFKAFEFASEVVYPAFNIDTGEIIDSDDWLDDWYKKVNDFKDE